jgi:uncharacterized protein YmfQ (DUF2313 family)
MAPLLPLYADPNRDRHIRRNGSDYVHGFLSLLPQGLAWPKETDSLLVKVVRGLCEYWGFVDSRAADLLERESDPRTTIDVTLPNGERDGLLPEWEKAWGLPDPCFPSATTITERQNMLVLFMTWMGGQSRDYFKRVARFSTGYEITIGEFAPFMCGISRVGDTRHMHELTDPSELFRWYIGPPEPRFVWTINVGQVGLTWFRAAAGQAGIDHHLKFSIPTELMCLLDRWKPAHTYLTLDFTELAYGGPMQGTP